MTETRIVSSRIAAAKRSTSISPARGSGAEITGRSVISYPAPGKGRQRIEHGRMFGGHADNVPSTVGKTFRNPANRQVVALRGPARPNDFFRARADGRGDLRAGVLNGVLGRRAEGMARAARIAVNHREIGQHRLDSPRIDAGRGVIVEIDG